MKAVALQLPPCSHAAGDSIVAGPHPLTMQQLSCSDLTSSHVFEMSQNNCGMSLCCSLLPQSCHRNTNRQSALIEKDCEALARLLLPLLDPIVVRCICRGGGWLRVNLESTDASAAEAILIMMRPSEHRIAPQMLSKYERAACITSGLSLRCPCKGREYHVQNHRDLSAVDHE